MLFFSEDVFTAVECGVDVFDSACVYAATERGCALTYPNTSLNCPSSSSSSSSSVDDGDSDEDSVATRTDIPSTEIDLNDTKYEPH